jgi:hypothetical protein
MGDDSERFLMADSIDRYLVKTGHKQLFGTQLTKTKGEKKFCLEPVEASFPDSRRFEYLKMSSEEYTAFVFKTLGCKQTPEETPECDHDFQSSPAGSVPGFW